MPRAQIFISYRRDDSAGYARAVYDELARHFGAERVFIDVDDIRAGQAFTDVIERAVGESEVLLVLIGKRWLGERDGGPPRIGDPGDFVALEVAAGLGKGMSVIPLLLDGATMPSPSQLPAALRALSGRNALELDNTRFAADVERLIGALREAIGEAVPASTPAQAPASARGPSTSRPALIAGALVAVVAIAAIWWAMAPPRRGAASDAASAPAAVGAVTARPNINGDWQADVTYDWPGAHYVERFVIAGEDGELHGSASFLGVPRGLLEGRVAPGTVRFVTRTGETANGASAETVHRYSGRVVGDEIRFVMQTEGGSSSHVPVEFTARRAAAAPAVR